MKGIAYGCRAKPALLGSTAVLGGIINVKTYTPSRRSNGVSAPVSRLRMTPPLAPKSTAFPNSHIFATEMSGLVTAALEDGVRLDSIGELNGKPLLASVGDPRTSSRCVMEPCERSNAVLNRPVGRHRRRTYRLAGAGVKYALNSYPSLVRLVPRHRTQRDVIPLRLEAVNAQARTRLHPVGLHASVINLCGLLLNDSSGVRSALGCVRHSYGSSAGLHVSTPLQQHFQSTSHCTRHLVDLNLCPHALTGFRLEGVALSFFF